MRGRSAAFVALLGLSQLALSMAARGISESALDEEDRAFELLSDTDDVFSPSEFAQEKREREEADPFQQVRFADAAKSTDTTGSCMAWKETPTSGDIDPGFRQGYGAFSLDMSPADPLFVVVGGQKSQSSNMGEGVLDRLDIFTLNLKSGKWAMPTPNGGIPKRVGAAIAWRAAQEGIGGKLLVFGGSSEDKATLFDDLHILEVAVQGLQPTYTWKPAPMSEGPKPGGRQAASLVALADGSLVLHGGYSDAGPLADTWTLSLANDVWTWTEVEATGAPSPRKDFSFVEWPNCGEEKGPTCVVAFGGNSGEATLGSVSVLNLGTKTWTEVSTSGDVPPAREGQTAFVVPKSNFMVTYGGCNMAANPQVCYDKVQALNLKTGEWTIVSFDAEMEVAAKGVQGAVFTPQYDGDAFFLYGGCDPFTSECQKRVISLRPKAVCPGGCENDGKYKFANGTCACGNGFKGDACEEKLPPLPCPADCSGHGSCDDGKCACTGGYSGADCSVFCPDDCSGHGACGEKKVCECEEGFVGDNCAERTCPDDCMRHGDCDPKTGKCACFPGYVTENCGMQDSNCPNNCTSAEGRGTCVLDNATGKTKCACAAQWGGADCNVDVRCEGGKSEEEACSGHGTCEAEKCKCDQGFTGKACTERTCPGDCGGKGKCNEKTGECACEPGATGLDCSEKFNCDAVLGCSKHGVCVADNKCECHEGWEGEGCDKKSCPHGKVHGEGVEATECSNHGTCDYQTGRCACEPTWGGKSCNARCPDRCNGHGTCMTTADGAAVCQCMAGFAGESCAKKESCPGADSDAGACNGRGTCFRGKCLCHPAYEGEDCSAPASCPGNCAGNGKCFNGKCECAPGFSGDDCSESEPCPGNCGGNGKCHGGKCVCDPGSSGVDCSTPVPCPGNCAGNGLCVKGQCACETGYTGEDCNALDEVMLALLPKCPHKCSGNGVCRAGKCFCDPGFEGDDCKTKKKARCPNKCSGQGTCRFGRCFCAPGFEGDDCSFEVPCPKNCSENGRCSNGKCFCDPGFKGEDCSESYSCPLDCSDRGICLDGKCMCVAGFGGEDCSKATASFDFCPHACAGHGHCEIGRCFCNPGWGGGGCGVAVKEACPDNCNGNGICRNGNCNCHPGFEGEACETKRACPAGCEEHGVCKYGKCYCAPGFKGDNCTEVVSSEMEAKDALAHDLDTQKPDCPNACSLRGMCFEGKCHCEPGYSGVGCEIVTVGHDQCPNDCRGSTTDADEPQKGMCVLGKCFCYPGWAGDDCGLQVQTPCPSDCSDNGKCHYGRCSCNYGWEGRACDQPAAKCEDDCNQHGLCVDGKCKCAKGWKGELCALEAPMDCPNDCNNRGACVLGRCFCHAGFDGEDCGEVMQANHTYTTNPVEPDYDATLESLRDAVLEGQEKAGEDSENCTTCMKEKAAKGAKVTEQQWVPLETPEVADRRTPADTSAGDSAAVNDADGAKDETLRNVKEEEGTAKADEPEEEGAGMMRFREGSACPSDCSNRGVCGPDATCTCDPGYEGAGCEVEAACSEDCGAHGACKLGKCFCDPGFEGADCATAVSCENDCSGNGVCQLGKCFCDAGFEGADCATSTPCPADCSGNGKCSGGKCFCDVGFAGEDCARASTSSCPSRCNGHGLCENGRCYCVQGYSGEDCQPIATFAVAGHMGGAPSVQPGWIGVGGGAVVLLLAGAALVAVQRRRAASSRDQPLITPEAPSAF